jgi:amino acid adenylation domain-containing protein
VDELAGQLGLSPDAMVRVAFDHVRDWLGGEDGGGTWRDRLTQPAPPTSGDAAVQLLGRSTLRYDTATVDAGYAARIGGYLVAALRALVADPDAAVDAADLMPAAEHHHLVYERAGVTRELPDARFHELFAARAAKEPDAIAVNYGGQSWTYDRLNRAANQVAHALASRGLRSEEVVAIGCGREPAWLAAIIGVFKAGGAYLPVEPDYPASRVANLLDQSGARFIITPPGGLPSVIGLPIDTLLTGPDHEPAVVVAAGQLAYVYFTSGSTGTPKGAMCEHAGMVNHLLAKIDDFGLGCDDVVVQNAEATFDISLWQLIAPLMVGGRTVIVPRAEILDVRRFLATIAEQRATVLQVVPSYLDVLLRATEDEPSALDGLRYVCVTGEAISKPLVSRFFAQHPRLRLVNAYGATEASDDTTHEVMTAIPPEDLVPVGRPVNNVTVYVLSADGRQRPLGSSGEIVFSGVCVGRGYINDPVRTAVAFGDDPFRPGQRLYHTGDFGRWLPSGSIEFHGRRDEQVKINGIRLELGEVESQLLSHPGVDTASVIVTPLPGVGKCLVGFYRSPAGLAPGEVLGYLRDRLPANAVPARLLAVDALPLTANGKVDKRSLAARAVAAEPKARRPPETPTEQRIAAAWASALDRPLDQISRDDHFFDIGGGSLSALRVVAALDGLIALPDLLNTPVLHAVAAAADAQESSA